MVVKNHLQSDLPKEPDYFAPKSAHDWSFVSMGDIFFYFLYKYIDL